MQMFGRASLVLAAIWAFAQGRPLGDDYPQVTGVRIMEESLLKHKTNMYRLKGGFVVRRGERFTLEVETSLPLDDDEIIHMYVNEEGVKEPVFATTEPIRVGHNRYIVNVFTDTDDPPGKYTNVAFQVEEDEQRSGRGGKLEGHSYEYPFPIYLIFNPYHSDEIHYVGDEHLINENLFHEWGPVFTGTLRDYSAIHWYYGQFDEKAIDTAFKMLEKMPKQDRYQLALVMQFLSHNIGCANQTKPVGNWDGVLYGRWFQDFPGGVEPGSWSSTIDIIDQWKKNGEKPAKYGQCWVFAAVQQTYMRALGIPARQVTALEAMIGKAKDKNNVTHHIVNYFYDHEGKLRHKEGHVWNFHSWNDVYIKRKTVQYSGWNVVDGTPTGKGPGSVQAIKDIADEQPYDVPAMVDSVKASVRNFLVNCTSPFTKTSEKGSLPADCTIIKTLKYNHEGVKKVITKLPSHEKSFEELDITHEYVDPKVDAYIQEPEYPPPPKRGDNAAEPIAVSLTASPSAIVGSPVEAQVTIAFPAWMALPEDGLEVNVAVSGDVMAYDESLVKPLEGATHTVRLTRTRPSATLTVRVSPDEYLVKNMHDLSVHLRAIALAGDIDAAAIDHVKVLLKAPEPQIHVPPLVAAATPAAMNVVHEVLVHLENPHAFDIEEACVDMFSPDLNIVNGRMHCVPIPAGKTIQVVKQFEAPAAEGTYPVTFRSHGHFLPTRYVKHDIVVVSPADHHRMHAY